MLILHAVGSEAFLSCFVQHIFNHGQYILWQSPVGPAQWDRTIKLVCKDWSAAPHHSHLAAVPWVQNTLNDGLILSRFIMGKDVIADLWRFLLVFNWLFCLKAWSVPELSTSYKCYFPP